jgi:hypothetical protein
MRLEQQAPPSGITTTGFRGAVAINSAELRQERCWCVQGKLLDGMRSRC